LYAYPFFSAPPLKRDPLGRPSDRVEVTVTRDPSTSTPDGIRITWSAMRQALTRPYPVTIPMVLLVSLVPVYLVIADRARASALHTPALALDRLVPLTPTWALAYGTLYAFLIVLPVLVVQQEELIRRTVWAYLTVWTVAYISFLLYPTVAPRPDTVMGKGFAVWGLRFLYNADPPYNCFPSLHVAHSFVSALACYRVHRTLGFAALSCASLVALSTLFTKQHYVADLIAGILLALVAYAVFLRGYHRANVPERDRRLAPVLALCVGGVAGLGLAGFWVAYQFRAWG
jgi:membrane-associated phospholipid phosphatase